MLHLDPITSPLSMPIQPLSRWRPHANTINAIVVLPDGDHVVTSDEDGRLLVSSLTQAKVVHDLSGHYGPVNTMALTPNGRYLITGSDDTTVRVWDIRSWETVHTLRGHSGFIRSVAANDSIIVSGAEDKLINVWDLESGECKKQFTGHEEDVWAVAISPDGTRLASSSLDNALWIRDINEGRIVHRLIEGGDIVVKLGGSLYQSIPNTRGGHESAVKRLIFVDSDMLLSCAEEIIRWDLKDGARSYEVIAKHVLPINDMALHPADNLLAFASGSVMVYDYKMGERRYVLSDTDAQQRVLSFIPRRTRIAAGTRDGELVVWSIDTAPPIESGVHSTYVYHSGITCTVDGAVLAVTIDGHNGMRLWNVADGTLVKAVDQYPCIAGKFFTFSPSGRTLITSFGENLLVWDTITGNLRHSLRFTDKKRPELISGALILNEKKALVGTKGNLAIWDLTGEGTPEVFDGITSDVETIATTSDQRLVYTIGSFAPKDADDGISLNSVNHLQCWNIPGRKLVWDQPAAKKTDGIIGMPLHFCCIAISPDNRHLVTMSGQVEEHLTVWDAMTGNPIRHIPINGNWVSAVRFSDNSILLCATSDDMGTYLLWLDIGTGTVIQTSQIANRPPRDIVITEDATLIVAAFNDEVQLINPKAGEVITRHATNVKLRTCAVSVDKRYVIAGDNVGRVHLFRISET